MKVKITLVYVECNTQAKIDKDKYLKVFFTDDDTIPSKWVSTKNEKESLEELCNQYFHVDFSWLVKSLADFRIVNNSGDMFAEAVYTIYAPQVVGALKSGKLLSFKDIHTQNIKVDSFYERILTTSGRTVFR